MPGSCQRAVDHTPRRVIATHRVNRDTHAG
jgi:hypothetical protein